MASPAAVLLILATVWLVPALGFSQGRDGGRPVARAAPARAPSTSAARPQGGTTRDRASSPSSTSTEGRQRGGSGWSRQDRAPASAARPGNDLFLAGPRTYAPRFDRRSRFFRYPYPFLSGYGYISDYYFPSYVPPLLPPPYSFAQDADLEPYGYLHLDVRPGTAQVFVDGFYVGTVDDVNASGRGLFIEAGPHRVEVRLDGFETTTFDVRIAPNQTTAYRHTLAKIQDRVEPAPPPVRGAPRTMYVIPRCYAGDAPPRSDQLPAGCDPARVRIVR